MTKNNQDQENWIILCRASTNKQGQKWETLENQEEACLFMYLSNNIKNIKTFKERYTWTKTNRPTLERMYKFIENSKIPIKYCAVHKIDRVTRAWVSAYEEIKKRLASLWVQLRDTQWIIQKDISVVNIEWIDTSWYDWAKENPWKYAENAQALMSEDERNRILQRTITQSIRNAKRWYQVRESNYWFQNTKIVDESWKRKTIQIPLESESQFILYMFKLKARHELSDKQICKEINAMWYKWRTRNKWNYEKTAIIWVSWWTKLKPNRLHEIITNPIYAWIRVEKWTWWKPVKTPYHWIVSIELWNQANRWKIKIVENPDWSIELLYWKNLKSIEVKETRANYNSDYPYSRVMKCPLCNWHLTPNKSRSWNLDYYHYYQCCWKKWIKHKNYKINRDEANEEIIKYIENIKPNNELLSCFNEILEHTWKQRASELESDKSLKLSRIQALKSKESQITNNISKIIDYPEILQKQNEELQSIKIEITTIQKEIDNQSNNYNLEEFKTISNFVLTQLDKLAIKKENPEIIKLVFSMIFTETPTYEEIKSHTNKTYPIFALQSQISDKNLKKSDDYLKWQACADSYVRLRRTSATSFAYEKWTYVHFICSLQS